MKSVFALIATACCFSSVVIAAETTVEKDNQLILEAIQRNPLKVESKFKEPRYMVGARYTFMNYAEGSLMSLKGAYQGFNAVYTHNFKDSNQFLKGVLSYDFGSVIYDGQTQGGTPITGQSGKDQLINAQVLFGKDSIDLISASDSEVKRNNNHYYGGLGYRTLTNKIEGSGFYTRQIDYIYATGGSTMKWAINESWVAGFNFEGSVLFGGNVLSKLSEADPTLPNVNNRLNYGYGIKLGLDSTHYTDSAMFRISPFIEYWSIGQSEAVRISSLNKYAVEPANSTLNYGLAASVLF